MGAVWRKEGEGKLLGDGGIAEMMLQAGSAWCSPRLFLVKL